MFFNSSEGPNSEKHKSHLHWKLRSEGENCEFTQLVFTQVYKLQFLLVIGATRGVTVSMSAFIACYQCCCAGSSLAWGHLSVCVGDSSRRCEEIVKNLE